MGIFLTVGNLIDNFNFLDIKFEVLMVRNIKIIVLWNATLCKMANRYQCCREDCCLHLEGSLVH
jgi:hypothetical protein